MYNQKPLLGTLINGGHPLAKGLVGAWILNENSGNTVFDLSGNRNHGIFGAGAASPTWISGRTGSALDFDGTNDYVEMSDYNFLNGLNGFTISVRIKSDISSADRTIFSAVGNDNFILRYDSYGTYGGGSNVIQFQVNTIGGEAGRLESSDSVQTTNWQHIVGTWNGTNLSLYLDGILDTPTYNVGATGQTTGATECKLGESTLYGTFWDGIIDEGMIYNRTLSAREIWQLYVEPYCMITSFMEAELMYAVPPVGVMSPYYYETLMAGTVI